MPSVSDFRSTAPGEQAKGVKSFSRHRYELPLLGAFAGIAFIELFVVHLLVSLWSTTAAWVLSGLTVLALAQIAVLVVGLVRWPTTMDDERITVRHGRRDAIVIPLTTVAAVENIAFAPEAKGRTVFRATLIAQPNVALRLAEPVPHRGRQLFTITMRLDEPEGFMAEVDARRPSKGPRAR